ncbi:MAG: VirB3 family type IV secretion system protein [Polyangiaceae bacterium]
MSWAPAKEKSSPELRQSLRPRSRLWWIILGAGLLGVVVAFVPALMWMRFVTSKDDQRFRQMFVAMKLRLHDRNHRFWHARSYALGTIDLDNVPKGL